jgi:hypothetical protein
MCSITDDVLYLGSLRAEGSYRLWWWISYQYSQVPARHSGSHLYPSYSGGRDWKDYRAPGSAQGPEFNSSTRKKKSVRCCTKISSKCLHTTGQEGESLASDRSSF